MAKQRYVRTSFRTDSYIEILSPDEKLIFLYLLTNESTNLCGIYEISEKRISFETGMEITKIKSILDKFTKDKRIIYLHGYICIRNYTKHQVNNPSIRDGIKRELETIPQLLTDELDKLSQAGGWLGTGWSTLPYLTKPNLTKPNHSVGFSKTEDDEEKKLDDIFSRNLDPQQQKIENSQKRQQVNTRGKSWIGIRNRITGRNDVMDSESFRNLQNFISDMLNEEFEARCSLFKKAIDLINKKNLGKYLELFGKNNIQDFTITEFIKKINLFGGSIDQVFKNITQKDNQSKVLRMIHEDDIKKIEPIQTPKPKEMNEEERKIAREQLQKSRDKMNKKIIV